MRKAESWWTVFIHNEPHTLIDDTFLRVITELAGGARMDKVDLIAVRLQLVRAMAEACGFNETM